MKNEALRLALEAFEAIPEEVEGWLPLKCTDAVIAIKQAMEQPEPEPVAWRTFDGEGGYDYRDYDMNENYDKEWAERNPNHAHWVKPLYTHPPKRERLTGHQLVQLWKDVNGDDFGGAERFARAIEAAHGIKGEA